VGGVLGATDDEVGTPGSPIMLELRDETFTDEALESVTLTTYPVLL